MYEHNERQMVMPDSVFLPFGGKLNPNNRWVKLVQFILQEKAEESYIQSLKNTSHGRKQSLFDTKSAWNAPYQRTYELER